MLKFGNLYKKRSPPSIIEVNQRFAYEVMRMAKYTVNCEKCGTEHTVELFGKVKYRYMELGIDSEDELPVKYGLCDECKEKVKQKNDEKIKQENNEKALPELSGSEKQISYAETLRKQEIERLQKYIQKLDSFTHTERTKKTVDEYKERVKYLYSASNAGEVINTILRG